MSKVVPPAAATTAAPAAACARRLEEPAAIHRQPAHALTSLMVVWWPAPGRSRILAPRAAVPQFKSARAPRAHAGERDERPAAIALPVAAVALEDLDLVAVGVLDEEEPRHQRAVAVELLDVGGLQPELLEAPVLGVEIVDRERDVAVAVAVPIGLARAPC